MARHHRQGDRALPPVSDVRRHGGQFALLALGALITVRLPLPGMALALLFVVLADIEGVRTARAMNRAGPGSRGQVIWCVCGIALISLLGLGVLGTVALYPMTYDRQQCLQGANTGVAKAACQDEFNRRIDHLQGRLVGG